MLIGQSLRARVGAASTYYSPWFPRAGTRAMFSCHMVASDCAASFQVQAQTKKGFDNFASANILSVGAANSIGLSPDTVTSFRIGNPMNGDALPGMNDSVRLVYTLTSIASFSAWVHFRMLNIVWEA